MATAILHGGHAYAQALWAAWRPPLAALAAALLVAGGARLLRAKRLVGCAVGAGAVAGLCVLAGVAWPPAGGLQRLAPVAAAATATALVATSFGPRGGLAGLGSVALLGGWFLAGGPLHARPPLPWIEAGGVAAVLALGAFGLPRLGALQVALAGISLACGMSAAHLGHAWVLAALVPAAATLGSAAAGAAARTSPALQPAAVTVAAVAAAWLLTTGDPPRLSPRPADAVVLAPLLAVWLAGRLSPRLHLAASCVGLAAATLAVWMVAGRR